MPAVTPNNSREVALSLSRDRLARALSRLDRLSRDAAETIAALRSEKSDLETQLQYQVELFGSEKQELTERALDLTRRFEQERSNFEQRAVLLQSVAAEAEERSKSLENLQGRQHELEEFSQDQTRRIDQLINELAERDFSLAAKDEQVLRLTEEIESQLVATSRLIEQLDQASAERDEFKSQLYEQQRQEAQWALKLTADDREIAALAIDKLIDRISHIEERTHSEQTA